jgi:6-pyruvoyltetrahydropterin/6-carboxytetrahydropterin synthase
MLGVGAHHELEVVCRGNPDPVTGYMMNISVIDKAVRDVALPMIQRVIDETQSPQIVDPGQALARIVPALQPKLGQSVVSVCWRLSPYYWVAMTASNLNRVFISQQFEFAAAHRLHVDSYSDARNREIFGKCNNPNGHGHNYRIEATVSVPLVTDGLMDRMQEHFTLADLEQIVDETIIQRFDHKHLNLDTLEFATLNPSVEHIAKVCHDLLVEPVRSGGGTLARVTIWETQKTRATYPAMTEGLPS